ncbi:MAG: dynamin family protein [Verrucomicrobiaceae bacterium]|nr:dynamin family protein [Verrucomicrobiaceae bacterium]
MIGEEYFELRGSIGTELVALGAAVREAGGGAEEVAIVENLITSLKEPFVFVVVGEVNVGKSTFLNALFGQDFSRTGVMPTTDKILFFRHGPEHAVVPLSPTLDEVRAPAEFLRDFHIVDTPGTNSIADEHQQITERFVPVADLVIFVFSAMNPWGASAWQFLEKVHRDWMRNVVFVLQQADLRSAEELAVITDYMGELCRGRFGREFPIFPVSGKKACLARSGEALNKDELLEQSGFIKLETHLSALVRAQPARQRKLAGTLHLGRQILEGLRHGAAARLHLAQRRSVLLGELLDEREMQVDRTLKKLLPALDATERDYHESVLRVAGLSQDLLATRRAFARPLPPEAEEERQQSLDRRLLQELYQRTGDRWRQTSLILDEDTRQYERYMMIQAGDVLPKEAISPTPSTTEMAPDGESELRRRFTTRIDSALRRFVLGLRLDEDIEPGLLRARETARWLPRLAPVVILVVLLAGLLGDWQKALILLLAGLMLLGMLFIVTQMRLAAARNAILDKLEESSATLREMLATQLKEEVGHGFSRFKDLLTPLQADALQQEQSAALQAERLRHLAESFATLVTKVG